MHLLVKMPEMPFEKSVRHSASPARTGMPAKPATSRIPTGPGDQLEYNAEKDRFRAVRSQRLGNGLSTNSIYDVILGKVSIVPKLFPHRALLKSQMNLLHVDPDTVEISVKAKLYLNQELDISLEPGARVSG
jgi:hypothetical protein